MQQRRTSNNENKERQLHFNSLGLPQPYEFNKHTCAFPCIFPYTYIPMCIEISVNASISNRLTTIGDGT